MGSRSTDNFRMNRARWVGRWLWLAMIAAALIWWACNPTAVTPENIHAGLKRYESWALLIYFAVSTIRGCFLIPSTPFVLAGALLFPDDQWLVFAISLIGVLSGSSIIYFFSDRLGFASVIERKHAAGLERVRVRMESHGVLIVILWSFFPLVPTDLVCYLAGVIQMRFSKFLFAVGIGEAVLIAGYVFGGPALIRWFG